MGNGPSAEQVASNYDGAGKIIVITGANSGIGTYQQRLAHLTLIVSQTELFCEGKEAARVFAMRGCTVVMCVRDKRRGDEAAAEIQAAIPAAKLNVMVRTSRHARAHTQRAAYSATSDSVHIGAN